MDNDELYEDTIKLKKIIDRLSSLEKSKEITLESMEKISQFLSRSNLKLKKELVKKMIQKIDDDIEYTLNELKECIGNEHIEKK